MGTKCVNLKSLALNLVPIFVSQSIQLFMFISFGVILKLCGRAKQTKTYLEHLCDQSRLAEMGLCAFFSLCSQTGYAGQEAVTLF